MKATRIVSLFAAAILMACLICGTVLASSPTGGTGGVVTPTRRPAPTRNPVSTATPTPTATPIPSSGTSNRRSQYDTGHWMYPSTSATAPATSAGVIGASSTRLTLQPLNASTTAAVEDRHRDIAASYFASAFSATYAATYETAKKTLEHMLSTAIQISGTNGELVAIEINVSGVKAGDTVVVVLEYPSGKTDTQYVVVATDGVVRFNATGDATVSVYKASGALIQIEAASIDQGTNESTLAINNGIGPSYATRSAGATGASSNDDAAPAAAAQSSGSDAPAQNLGVVTLPKTGNANVALPAILLLVASIGALALSAKAFRRSC